jgi:hypothetical protein
MSNLESVVFVPNIDGGTEQELPLEADAAKELETIASKALRNPPKITVTLANPAGKEQLGTRTGTTTTIATTPTAPKATPRLREARASAAS